MHPASIPARLSIIAESPDWIVIDKPPLLQIHPSKPSDEATLWHLLRELLVFEIANGGQVSIINRLDRETSGLVLIAKSQPKTMRAKITNGTLSAISSTCTGKWVM